MNKSEEIDAPGVKNVTDYHFVTLVQPGDKKAAAADQRNIIMSSKEKLCDLQEGDHALISEITSDNENLIKRLLHLGFLKGQRIDVVLKNSKTSPLTVRVRGTLVALRRSEAEAICIERDSHE